MNTPPSSHGPFPSPGAAFAWWADHRGAMPASTWTPWRRESWPPGIDEDRAEHDEEPRPPPDWGRPGASVSRGPPTIQHMGNRRRRGISRAWGVGGVAALAAGVLLVAGLALGQAREEAPANAGSVPTLPASEPSATVEPLRVAAVGDSITAADSPDFAAGRIGSGSWLSSVLGDGVVFAGGWAQGGVNTDTMVANVSAPLDADVLVLLGGVNDYGNGVPFATTTRNYDTLVATIQSDRVLIGTVPPKDDKPDAARAFNEDLKQLAADRGWSFVDASAKTRDGNGKYLEGFTTDGTHPTPEAAKVIGAAVRAAVLDEQ
ncbi:SGNH/GDSL hydrolase family protein [Clavibacter lycopersici]|uniref:SGNH/GDSL hydrolase family protein n=1 Tax=Clavibacter lycopersici TaxID=2301718 RepID=A0A399TEA7_9MICO|nr:SGNH/GDSL hydrolase family protein [Clavibacter lycopersici]RIJ62352.1 SGNH/GDSL hydrolase family protein [Clavibacter lycopersici]